MTPPVVVDTNIVIAGLLTARDAAPVARILDAMLAGRFPFVVSQPLLAEYRDVLARPRLRKAHGLAAPDREAILVGLAQHAIVLRPAPALPAPDPGDQHLWELLAARDDLHLVTGDKRLFEDARMRPRLLTAGAFVAHWPAEHAAGRRTP